MIFPISFNLPIAVLIIIGIINVAFVIFIVFFERRQPVSALAWVLTFAFLPVIGFLLYLLIGIRPRFRKRRKYIEKGTIDSSYSDVLSEQLHLVENSLGHDEQHFVEQHFINESSAENLAITENICFHLLSSHSIYTNNNQIEVFLDGKDKYEALLEDLESAKKHIHMAYFIYRNDNIGREIIKVLAEKAKAGVEVRLLVDGIGSFFTSKKTFKPLEEAGGQVTIFSPASILRITHLNYRNHRKIVVVDGKIAYLGGMNIGDEYANLTKRPWRDTHMRLTGSSVYLLQMRFLTDWMYIKNENLMDKILDYFAPIEQIKTGNIGMQIVSSGPDHDDEYIKLGYIKMINTAKNCIYIETPYFVPDTSFKDALALAAKSGIEIHIILPGIYDKMLVYRASMSYVQDFIDFENVHFYLYDGFIHSKMIIVDDIITTIGTTNIDERSFSIHFETNAFIYNKDFTKKCINIFKNDVKKSKILSPEDYRSRPIRLRILEQIMRLFSPIL